MIEFFHLFMYDAATFCFSVAILSVVAVFVAAVWYDTHK